MSERAKGEVIKNNSEILFVYDVMFANPNGDPDNENLPRVDEDTGLCYVTSDRLKRTIRDYLFIEKNQKIFIQPCRDEEGYLISKKELLKGYQNVAEILADYIDIRLFGATFAADFKNEDEEKDEEDKQEKKENNKEKKNEKKKKIFSSLIGPVQWSYGSSFHRVKVEVCKGTTVIHANNSEKRQGTFTERPFLYYALIGFYGRVNKNTAKHQSIPLTLEDIDLMLEAVWIGTKKLMTTSKRQMPRLLIEVVYKDGVDFIIGELDRLVKVLPVSSEKDEPVIRDVEDIVLDVTQLVERIQKNIDKIEKVRFKCDERLKLVAFDKRIDLGVLLGGEKFSFE